MSDTRVVLTRLHNLSAVLPSRDVGCLGTMELLPTSAFAYVTTQSGRQCCTWLTGQSRGELLSEYMLPACEVARGR